MVRQTDGRTELVKHYRALHAWSPVIWATNHGRQTSERYILVNWATEVETTGPQRT